MLVRRLCPLFQLQKAPKPFSGLWSSESPLPSCLLPPLLLPTCMELPFILEQV